MTNKIILELSPIQVERLIEKLPLENKIRIARKLTKETIRSRWNKILKNIDDRRRNSPHITDEEIAKEVDAARKELYSKSHYDKSRR